MIPSGYAIAYRDFSLDTKIAYPIPLHFVVRWARDFRFWLMTVGRPSYRERIEGVAFRAGREIAYEQYAMGVRDGRRLETRDTLARLETYVAKRKEERGN